MKVLIAAIAPLILSLPAFAQLIEDVPIEPSDVLIEEVVETANELTDTLLPVDAAEVMEVLPEASDAELIVETNTDTTALDAEMPETVMLETRIEGETVPTDSLDDAQLPEIEYVFSEEIVEPVVSAPVETELRTPSEAELRWLDKLEAEAAASRKRYEMFAISVGSVETDLQEQSYDDTFIPLAVDGDAPQIERKIVIKKTLESDVKPTLLDIDVKKTGAGDLLTIVAFSDDVTESIAEDGSQIITATSGDHTTVITITPSN